MSFFSFSSTLSAQQKLLEGCWGRRWLGDEGELILCEEWPPPPKFVAPRMMCFSLILFFFPFLSPRWAGPRGIVFQLTSCKRERQREGLWWSTWWLVEWGPRRDVFCREGRLWLYFVCSTWWSRGSHFEATRWASSTKPLTKEVTMELCKYGGAFDGF